MFLDTVSFIKVLCIPWFARLSTTPLSRHISTSCVPTPLLGGLQTVFHYGWIPFIIYYGYTKSQPQPSLIKLISPLA
ncbi:uncharacterized protein EI90DRAFT_3038942 [Cantharellus anzutake]|uniref:uncharacterized protein n=1 Tax=Cantharellus anzutake TaxID=1750568 RepID=UPI0019035A0B|nr:uncharacterized protein EI90DRAFT_3038942 [Cantharellus anzutake]KAF8338745.1 hypothetical protein EI90DRAFT_3038942 [Cantharellus anzutake]